MLSSARGPETTGMGKQGWAECAAEASAGVNVGTKATLETGDKNSTQGECARE